MTDLVAVQGRILVVGLDSWGERVAAAVGAHVGHALVPELHVLAVSETDDPDRACAHLAADGDRLIAHQLSVLTAVRDAAGIWIGPLLAPGASGCTHCRQARRHRHAELLTPVPQRCSADADVPLAALAILAVTRRLLSASVAARSPAGVSDGSAATEAYEPAERHVARRDRSLSPGERGRG